MTAVTRLPDPQLAGHSAHYRASLAARRLQGMLFAGALAVAVLIAASGAEVAPAKLIANIGSFTSYLVRIFHLDNGQFVLSDPAEWFWGWEKWLRLLLDTLLIAYVGTLAGALGAFALCFPAARNLMPVGWVRFATKRYLEFCRTVPELVFALIFVVAFGLGPLPGVLAIAIHTTGALGKLFAEVVENIDMRPVEGIVATGASWVETVRFAALPQVLSNLASYSLLRFEINVRGAAIMGFVGAGGIGQNLLESIRKFYYSDVSAILVLIIATVMVVDMLTERLRHALARVEGAR